MFKKFLTTGAAGALILTLFVQPMLAATPRVQACLGTDISNFAQNGQPDGDSDFVFAAGAGWGGFIAGVANSPGADGQVGVGGEIAAHQAGFIPDFVIPNSCNN